MASPGRFAAIANAAIVLDGGLVAWAGPLRGARRRRGGRRRGTGGAAGFVDSHAHLVFAGERGAEFAARMAGQPYSAGGIASTVAATRAAPDDQLRGNCAGWLPRCWPGHDHVRVQVRLRPDRGGGGAGRGVAAELMDEVTYLGAHVVPAEFAATRPLRRPGQRRDAGCVRAARAVDRRVLRARCLRRGRGRRGAGRGPGRRPAGPAARQPARPRPGGAARGRGRRRFRRPLHLSVDADVDALARRTLWPRCCPGWSSPPGSPTRTPARLLDAGATWRWPPTATRARASPRAWRCASPWPYARCT